jgi:biopolymer transport protein ExbB
MSVTETAARWAVLTRWIAYLGIGVVLALGYTAYKPAAAQEKTKPPAEKAAAEKPPAPGSQAARDEAAKRAEELFKESPQDAKAPAASAEEEPTLNLINIVLDPKHRKHMWAVWAILVVSVFTVGFAIERVLGLRRSKVVPGELMAALRALAGQKGGFDPRQAYRLCRQYPSAAATVIKVMLQKVGRPLPEIEHAVTETSEREASRLYANVRWQSLAFNVAPMLGLAGTVHGMIIAFFVTANMQFSMNRMSSLGTGIYAALICTFAGLIVAIPAGILAHLFEGRIMKLFREIDDVAHAMLPQLERFEGRPRGVKTVQPEPPVAAESGTIEALEDPKAKWPVVSPKAQ